LNGPLQAVARFGNQASVNEPLERAIQRCGPQAYFARAPLQHVLAFLGMELLGGYVLGNQAEGWEAGAFVRPQRGLGFGGSVAQTSNSHADYGYYLAGVRLYSPVRQASRFFAHAMGGGATARPSTGPSQNAYAIALGGGVDLLIPFTRALVVRLQLDWIGTGLDSAALGADDSSAGHVRVQIAASVPLCFRGCTDWDGIQVAR
jgi:hypothetical protein